MSFVDVSDIHFAFAGSTPPIFAGFSLTIERGECVGLTGPSGCGKSTLAKIIAGHLRPDRGHVRLDGQDVTGRPQRGIILVPQESDLFPWLPVARQIAFGLERPDDGRVRELMKLTKLDGVADFLPHRLSGGMKRRLAIARALAIAPKLLIFDESFAALDFELRRELFADLKEIWHATRTTILLVTHDPRDLAEIAPREIRLARRSS